MPNETLIQQQAEAALRQKLQALNCTILAQEQQPKGECITIALPSGEQHTILMRLLNLDKGRSLSILKTEFGTELRHTLWVLLVLHMQDMEQPLCYLVPSMVFATPNDIFIDREQPGRFNHLSMWEIKVFTRGIETLSAYALETAVIL